LNSLNSNFFYLTTYTVCAIVCKRVWFKLQNNLFARNLIYWSFSFQDSRLFITDTQTQLEYWSVRWKYTRVKWVSSYSIFQICITFFHSNRFQSTEYKRTFFETSTIVIWTRVCSTASNGGRASAVSCQHCIIRSKLKNVMI